jgi:hypothetical protein
VVAVDGRYNLFPAEQDASPAEQRAVLDAACRHHGMGLTVYVPDGPWESESVKRTQLFGLALAVSDHGDWWFNADADTIITEWPASTLEQLATAEQDSAEVTVVDVTARKMNRPDYPAEFRSRILFRAAPIVVTGHHYDYVRITDGKVMWRGADPSGLDPALDLTATVTVEHQPQARPPSRLLRKGQYYTRRDHDGAEMGKCARCDEPARHRVYTRLRMVKGLPVGSIEELCDEHRDRQEAIARRWLRQRELDPDQISFHESYAPPTAKAKR